MRTTPTLLSLLLSALITLPIVCAAGQAQKDTTLFIQESERFCMLFKPNVWTDMKKDHQGAALMDEFLRRVDEAVNTPEFEAILDQQYKQEKTPTALYQYYIKEISALTAIPFSCPDLKTYFEESIR